MSASFLFLLVQLGRFGLYLDSCCFKLLAKRLEFSPVSQKFITLILKSRPLNTEFCARFSRSLMCFRCCCDRIRGRHGSVTWLCLRVAGLLRALAKRA